MKYIISWAISICSFLCICRPKPFLESYCHEDSFYNLILRALWVKQSLSCQEVLWFPWTLQNAHFISDIKFSDYQGTGKSKQVSQPEASVLPSISSHSADHSTPGPQEENVATLAWVIRALSSDWQQVLLQSEIKGTKEECREERWVLYIAPPKPAPYTTQEKHPGI